MEKDVAEKGSHDFFKLAGLRQKQKYVCPNISNKVEFS